MSAFDDDTVFKQMTELGMRIVINAAAHNTSLLIVVEGKADGTIYMNIMSNFSQEQTLNAIDSLRQEYLQYLASLSQTSIPQPQGNA